MEQNVNRKPEPLKWYEKVIGVAAISILLAIIFATTIGFAVIIEKWSQKTLRFNNPDGSVSTIKTSWWGLTETQKDYIYNPQQKAWNLQTPEDELQKIGNSDSVNIDF